LNKETLDNTTMHLTNVAVQKKADNYDAEIGGKWDLNRMRIFLKSVYGDAAIEELFVNLEQIMIYAVKAVQKAIIQDPHCFELYGFDVMVDDQLRPWLLEVNASPSLSANTTEDYWVKYGLLDDVVTVLDIEGRGLVTQETLRVGGFDAVVRNNEFVLRTRSTLGTANNRREQIRQICEARRPARSKARMPDDEVE
jgi:tubulin polyglutamylase TTLL9